MGTRYVEVTRAAMMKAMEAAGFSADAFGGELVYVRRHHVDPTMLIKVYTSMPAYEHTGGRPCGEDAIKVVLVFENPRTSRSGCLHKAKRVFRTGSEEAVIERTLERARECYQEANTRLKSRSVAQRRNST